MCRYQRNQEVAEALWKYGILHHASRSFINNQSDVWTKYTEKNKRKWTDVDILYQAGPINEFQSLYSGTQ